MWSSGNPNHKLYYCVPPKLLECISGHKVNHRKYLVLFVVSCNLYDNEVYFGYHHMGMDCHADPARAAQI